MPRRKIPSEAEIETLLQRGKEKGFITYEEIDAIFTEDSVWSPHLEELLARFEEKGIKIIDHTGKEAEEILEEAEELREEVAYVEEPIRIYLNEISQIPLLHPTEERRLAKMIEEEKEKIKRIELEMGLSTRRIKRLYKELKEGKIGKEDLPESLREKGSEEIESTIKEINSSEDKIYEAKKKFIESNLRLVVSIAKRYAHRKMPLLDLIDEGNLGLIRAVDKFDYKEGYKFSTYASWWIRQAITRALSEQCRTIRVPVYMAERINRCVKVTRDLLQKLGRQPTIPEIAKEMKLPISKVVELLSVAQEPSSLEAPVGEEGEDQLGDLIEDKTTLSPSDTVFLTMLQEQMDALLNSTLSRREKKILELRFGLKGNKPHTLNEIGDILNITRERVRQLEMRSLKKLRELEISSELHEILEESS